MINIILAIALNLILVGVLVAEIFVGRKQGWLLELSKLVVMGGAIVGSYFSAPIVNNFIQDKLSLALSVSDMTCVLTLLASLVVIVIFAIISSTRRYIKVANNSNAKVQRAKSIDKNVEKQLLKEERASAKLNRTLRTPTKASKIFGMIFGLLVGCILCIAIYKPVKTTVGIATEITGNDYTQVCEYTAIGQLEKAFDCQIEKIIDFKLGE